MKGLLGSRIRVRLFCLLMLGLAATLIPADGVPQQIRYQGRLLDANSLPVETGEYNLTAALWSAESGGSNLWSETHADVPVVRGYFSLVLGSQTNGLDEVLAEADCYIEISGAAVPSVRQRLLSMPYAINAASAETVQGVNLLEQVKMMQSILGMVFEDESDAEFAPIPSGVNSGIDPDFGSYAFAHSEAYFMDKHEITKGKWDEVYEWGLMNGYLLDDEGYGMVSNHPVQVVSWDDCVVWCNARSEMDGYAPCYKLGGNICKTSSWVIIEFIFDLECDFNANGYRLPTSSEWEYAARGGLVGRRFPWGDTITHSLANYNSSSSFSYDISPTRGGHPVYSGAAPVGSFIPNGYGLYDMAGNVQEWCWDAGSYPVERVVRGGGGTTDASYARVGNAYFSPIYEQVVFGFRTVHR